jgi:hypothetical protein
MIASTAQPLAPLLKAGERRDVEGPGRGRGSSVPVAVAIGTPAMHQNRSWVPGGVRRSSRHPCRRGCDSLPIASGCRSSVLGPLGQS